MSKTIAIRLLAIAMCLAGSMESAQAIGGRRRATENYANPAATPTVSATVPVYQKASAASYPYQAGPRTQGPCYAYPNTDPRRFNFQYNH